MTKKKQKNIDKSTGINFLKNGYKTRLCIFLII